LSKDTPRDRDRPLEEAQKNYRTILEQQVEEASEELDRTAPGILLSALSAGLDLGFGPFLMAVALTLVQDTWSHAASKLILANAYAVGFVFVVMGRSTLFTERTMSAVLPVLARGEWGLLRLLRLWGLALLGNLVGAAAIAAAIALLGPAMHVVEPKALQEIAQQLTAQPWWMMLVSAVLAGWLMGLMTWLVTASRDSTAQLIAVWMTAAVIGLIGLHHSIAGTIEILMAVFANQATLASYGQFIVWAVIGNAIGGSCFVALLKFGHVRASEH
jgi:formate/nitrite transporter FocA (FNT family)